MARSLSGSLITELATDKLNPVDLVYIGVSTGYYYTDHYKNISFGGNTYQASTLLLGVSEASETSEVSVNDLVLKFSGADQTMISLFLNYDYMNKQAFVYRGFLDANQTLISDPFLLFDGRIENFNITETDNTSEVAISIASHWADFDKIAGRKTNTNSQKLYFSTDKGFDFASQSVKEIKWGRAWMIFTELFRFIDILNNTTNIRMHKSLITYFLHLILGSTKFIEIKMKLSDIQTGH